MNPTAPTPAAPLADRAERLRRAARALEDRIAQLRLEGAAVPPALGDALAGFRAELAGLDQDGGS